MKIIKISSLVFVAILFLLLSFLIFKYNQVTYKNFTTESSNTKNEEIVDNETLEEKHEEQTSQESTINSSKDSNINSNNNNKNHNSNSSNNKIQNDSNNNVEIDNNNGSNNNDVIQNATDENEFIQEKYTCTSNDEKYISWLDNYLSLNSSTRIFDTLESALSFGEDKMWNYGYGYFYSKYPTTYEDDICKKNIYTLQLYIPAKKCGNNPMTYLPNNVEVINSIQYLRNLGYSCDDKIVEN